MPNSLLPGNFVDPTRPERFGPAAVTKLRRASVVGVLAGAALAMGPTRADDLPVAVCRLVLLEERTELEDVALDLDLARSEAHAMEEVFKLVESLWKEEAIERIVFLRAKHDRDVARLGVEEKQLRLASQQAVVDQYELACDSGASDRSPENRRQALDAAHDRHRRAECDLLAVRAERAAVDLEYSREVLASVIDLREHDVATRQDVILAEMNVEVAEKTMKQTKQRAEACRTPDKGPR